tara:strand:+ start:2283 stop:2495 length:213 start_codon:yes stop_codon:yes gene_type:complete
MNEDNYKLTSISKRGKIHSHRLFRDGKEIEYPFDEIPIRELVYKLMESNARKIKSDNRISKLEISFSLTD